MDDTARSERNPPGERPPDLGPTADTGRAAAPPQSPGPGSARARLAAARLCVLVGGGADQEAFARLLAGLFAAGVPMIQLRDKALGAAQLAERTALAVALARQCAAAVAPLVIVNDRPDVAVAGNADGVHVGAEDLPVPLARHVIGPELLLGRTAHDIDEARKAAADGADMLGVGPCFPSTTKAFDGFAPRSFLAKVAADVPLPAFAIGGVTIDRLDDLATLGLVRVAVGAAITAAADPALMAARFLARLTPAAGRPPVAERR